MRRIAIPAVVVILGACGESTKKNPPDTAFDTLPAVLSNQKRVEIGFHALGNANTFLCKLDSADETQCVPPFVADVADGPHTFTVAAALNDAVDVNAVIVPSISASFASPTRGRPVSSCVATHAPETWVVCSRTLASTPP